ncbi:hypothetical protein HUU42_02905 [bacterium]|nr:hypothetical protein [bacterium]
MLIVPFLMIAIHFWSLETGNLSLPKEVMTWGITKVNIQSIPTPPDNPLTDEKIALGRKLFYDPVLSGTNTTSCATCHNPRKGLTDCAPLSTGDNGVIRKRRSPALNNLAWNDHVFWDGRAELLEDQVLADKSMDQVQATWPEELKAAGYEPLFQKVFGKDSALTAKNVAKAIASYERTLISHNSPFDQYTAGDSAALSEQQKRGLLLFSTKANCIKCHSGPNFTDGGFHDIGLPDSDIGRFQHVKIPTMQHAFKTPGLRDVANRSFFMHDGSSSSLEDIIALYNEGGRAKDRKVDPEIKPLGLTKAESEDLVAFLKALSGKVNY